MGKLLWKPSEERIRNTHMYRFMNIINEKYHQKLDDYDSLWVWSTENIPDFWATLWDFAADTTFCNVSETKTNTVMIRKPTALRMNL